MACPPGSLNNSSGLTRTTKKGRIDPTPITSRIAAIKENAKNT
jgi:hypothetical protein